MSSMSPCPSVGVKAIILRDQQLLTIVKQYPEGIAYILPGGKQEFGETLEHAIQRECREELGGDMIVERLLFVREYIILLANCSQGGLEGFALQETLFCGVVCQLCWHTTPQKEDVSGA